MSDLARAKTAEEVRQEFLDHLKLLARYWAELPDKTNQERTEGLIHSILVTFDGCSSALTGMIISMDPHPSDKEYHKSNGENWYPKGLVINNCSLHEIWER